MKNFLIALFASFTTYYFYAMENKKTTEYIIMYFNEALIVLSLLSIMKNTVFD